MPTSEKTWVAAFRQEVAHAHVQKTLHPAGKGTRSPLRARSVLAAPRSFSVLSSRLSCIQSPAADSITERLSARCEAHRLRTPLACFSPSATGRGRTHQATRPAAAGPGARRSPRRSGRNDALCRVVGRAVDQGGNRIGLHQFGRKWADQMLQAVWLTWGLHPTSLRSPRRAGSRACDCESAP